MDRTSSRKLIHIDMDASFASVELHDDLVLSGRPEAIRHVVASYEAREFDVRSALLPSTALHKWPDLSSSRRALEAS